MLAVAYFFGITDLHCDNIIARGASPIPIDLETILHPESVTFGSGLNRADSRFSLFDTMLIPGVQRGLAVDMAGLAKTDRHLSDPLPVWDRGADERLCIVDKPTRLAARLNLPRLKLGDQALPEEHHHALAMGLTSGYQDILADRGAIEEILSELTSVPTRTVLRPTSVYMQLLADCRHPSLLKDALQSDLWRLQLGTSEPDEVPLLSAFPTEWRALARGDVPVFWALGGSNDLFSHDDELRVATLGISGLERVRARLRSPPPLEQFQWQLHCGLVVGSRRSDGDDKERVSSTASQTTVPLTKAREIGDALLKLAVTTDRGGLDWLTVTRGARDDTWGVHVLNPDLYEGLAGVALFLLYLGMATSESAYSDAGERALWEAFCRWKEGPAPHGGGYTGSGSVLYSMIHASLLGVRWSEAATNEIVERLLVAESAVRDGGASDADILHGDAGLLLVVLRLIEFVRSDGSAEDPRLRNLAQDLTTRLTNSAVPGAAGEVAWQPGTNFGIVPLCGFSHGASGVALALSEAARILDELALRSTVGAALLYESNRYAESAGTWLNLVSEDAEAVVGEPNRELCSWCNGAPGIGIVRNKLRSEGSYSFMDDRLTLDIERSLRAIEAGLSGLVSDCLCHGSAGTLEAAISMCGGHGHPMPAWVTKALHRLSGQDAATYACSNPLGITTPGLMSGISGIGMFWLRVGEVPSIPCVLSLEGPRRAKRSAGSQRSEH